MPSMCSCIVASPLGRLILVADHGGLAFVLFPNADLDSVGLSENDVTALPEDPETAVDHPVLARASQQLAQYFAGERREFDLPLHPSGNPFELDVWHALATIPYGETLSYGQQAERIGRTGAARAVGAANGRNPLPIVLPCHRVVGADGSLTGFGGGLDLKRQLLDLESGAQRLPF